MSLSTRRRPPNSPPASPPIPQDKAGRPTSLFALAPDPTNPRRMPDAHKEALSKSIDEFGDIALLLFNTRTQHLVAGHQRIEKLRSYGDLPIEILPDPDYGRVRLPNGDVFLVRFVDWAEDKERAANIQANNRHASGFR